jgi:tetratricopeptide (TPR) repeat protein
MASHSLQQLFGAAERAFVAGRVAEARALLLQLESQNQPAVHHLLAMAEQRLGELAAARRHFERAVALAPRDPQIWNNFGILLGRLDDREAAIEAYDRALTLAPRFADALFNRSLLLRRAGRLDEARAGYEAAIALNPNQPRFWNGLGDLEKAAGDLAAAAAAYDRALGANAADPLATLGRARVALERDEPDVLSRYDAARRLAPDMVELLIDQTEARLARGDRAALDDLAQAVAARPDWSSGQIALARFYWEQGRETGFADHVEARLTGGQAPAQYWRDYVQLLLACKLPDQAADAAARAGRCFPDDSEWALTEAAAAGKAGQLERAEALFAALPEGLPARATHECVHRIRQGDYARALRLAEDALGKNRWDFATWALVELLYRKLGDPRGVWLSGQPGLVASIELPIEPAAFAAADVRLRLLHQTAIETVGQSVRGGSQTRWNLFDRIEPELPALRSAVTRGIADYVGRLPPRDDTHPLLRLRDRPMRVAAAWSVLLRGSGYHEPHYHPEGLISSACYFRIPQECGDRRDGWLEIGRPSPDLLIDLEPIATIEPVPGRLVLFPSYLFHGTRPFAAGERMTIAFDVVAG